MTEEPDQLMSLPVSDNNNVEEDVGEVAAVTKKSVNSVSESVPQPGIKYLSAQDFR